MLNLIKNFLLIQVTTWRTSSGNCSQCPPFDRSVLSFAFCYNTRSHLGSFSSVQQGRSSKSYGSELMNVKTLGLLFSTGKDKWVFLALKS